MSKEKVSQSKGNGELAHPMTDRRVTYIIFSLLILLGAIIAIKALTHIRDNRPTPPAPVTPVEVQGLTVTCGTQPVCVTAFGTVQSAKVIELLAPYEARIVGSNEPFPGQFVEAEELIFQLDTRQIDLNIAGYKAQIRQLEVDTKELVAAIALMEDQLETSKRMLALNEATFKTQQADFAIQSQIFEANASLYSTGDISYTNYLSAQERLNQTQVNMLRADESVGRSQNSMDQIAEQLVKARANLCNIPNQTDTLMTRIKQQLIDRAKGRMSVPWPAGVVSVSAATDMEVLPGTPMATVQSMDEVEIPINIPDSYFKWVFTSPAFTQVSLEPSALPEITITLVNSNFAKSWKGGYIKAISQNLNVPTRSLPIVVGRSNEVDENGQLVPDDALKPGMYCEVSLYINEIEDAFLVPLAALQTQNRIYYGVPVEGEQNQYTLEVISDVQVLYEAPGGAVVRLPEQFQTLTIVTHQMMTAQPGMLLSIHLPRES